VTRNITVKFLEAWNKFKKKCILVAMATSAILNFINTPKASTHYGKYFYDED
jgi:phenylpyruvate tautomerase PptA (4-oxalocrotonate tautomerase family)